MFNTIEVIQFLMLNMERRKRKKLSDENLNFFILVRFL
jgi:hypothetical protein